MYSLFLVLGVALVILSHLALELWLTAVESRRQRLADMHLAKLTRTRSEGLAWHPARARW